MQIRRRELMHLLGMTGLGYSGLSLLGCGSDDDPPPQQQQPVGCQGEFWHCGNYAPVDESEAFDLEVVGTLPSDLTGLYVRNGANQVDTGHWFLGDGMVHGVRLENGTAPWYRARYVQTSVLGQPDDGGLPMPADHVANTSIIDFQDKLYALAEIGFPYEMRRDDLTTVGTHNFNGALTGSMTAHPKFDSTTGELLFFGYELLEPKINYYAVDPSTGEVTQHVEINLPAPVMMHDFQVTATHVVIMDLPVLFDIELAIDGQPMPFRWGPENGARIGVMPRDGDGTDIQWFEIDPCYIFHTFNAYNDPADASVIVLHAVRYPEMWVEGSNSYSTQGDIWRYRLHLPTGEVQASMLIDTNVEFPRIDPRQQGYFNQYGYGVAVTSTEEGDIKPADSLMKFDLELGAMVDDYQLPDGMALDETLFIPASDTGEEDEGWLLGYAYDSGTDTSSLMVFDATSLSSGPAAEVKLPVRVPHGFHGTWSSD